MVFFFNFQYLIEIGVNFLMRIQCAVQQKAQRPERRCETVDTWRNGHTCIIVVCWDVPSLLVPSRRRISAEVFAKIIPFWGSIADGQQCNYRVTQQSIHSKCGHNQKIVNTLWPFHSKNIDSVYTIQCIWRRWSREYNSVDQFTLWRLTAWIWHQHESVFHIRIFRSYD